MKLVWLTHHVFVVDDGMLLLFPSGLSWVCHWTTAGSLLAYQGHGIPEWKNDADFFHFFINKNGHILDLVDYKHVVPKGRKARKAPFKRKYNLYWALR